MSSANKNKSLAVFTTDSSCSYQGDSLNCHVGLTHDCHVLFESSDFTLHRGTVTGLVGTNGAGKTSLAMLLASKELPGFPSQLSVQYISASEDDQVVDEPEILDMTPLEFLQSRVQQQLEVLQQEIDSLEELLEENNNDDDEQVEQVVERLSQLYDTSDSLQESMQREVQQILDVELGFGPHLHKTLAQLSSGWRYKCRLAAALLVHADLLLVDEPSFLDQPSTMWLVERMQQVAKQERAMVVLISHKDYLLDAACDDQMLYINAANKTLTQYHCGYCAFRETHAAQVAASKRAVEAVQDKVVGADKSLQHIQSQLHKRETNLKRQTVRNADQRFIKGKNKEAKQKADRSAASKVKQLKKQQAAIEESNKQKTVTDRVKPIRIEGVVAQEPLAVLQDVAVSFDDGSTGGEYVFENVEARLEPRDRILLAGENGCGKSTLIKVILGQLEPTKGSCRLGSTTMTRSLYFPQTSLNDLLRFHGKESAVSYLSATKNLTETQLRQHLGNFGLQRDVALRPISSLSAGQHVRLWLAKQLLDREKPTLLVLDEISENVDMQTRQSLIDLLNHFNGAVLVVSHDHDFCEAFEPTQVWNLGPHGIRIEYKSELG